MIWAIKPENTIPNKEISKKLSLSCSNFKTLEIIIPLKNAINKNNIELVVIVIIWFF